MLLGNNVPLSPEKNKIMPREKYSHDAFETQSSLAPQGSWSKLGPSELLCIEERHWVLLLQDQPLADVGCASLGEASSQEGIHLRAINHQDFQQLGNECWSACVLMCRSQAIWTAATARINSRRRGAVTSLNPKPFAVFGT